MVMKNATESTSGVRYTQAFSANGAAGPVTIAPGVALFSQLSAVYSKKGDFRTPNDHRYFSSRQERWSGVQYAWVNGSRAFILTRGLLGIGEPNRFPVPSSYEALAYNKAHADLVEKIRGNMDLSIDLIQWRQVKEMLSLYTRGKRGLIAAVQNAFTSVALFEKRAAQRKQRQRRGRLTRFNTREYERWYYRNARKLAKNLARARLEYVYGIKPLCSTIADLGALIANPQDKSLVRVRGRGKVAAKYDVWYGEFSHRIHGSYFATISLNLKPPPTVLSNLSRISSLNPASIAWEALPFSFVVDWFVNVGGWLRSVETAYLYGSSFGGGYSSRGYKVSDIVRSDRKDGALMRSAKAAFKQTSFNRSKLTSFPMPRVPPFEMNLGTGQVLNGLALIAVNASRVDNFIRSFAKR